MSRYSFRVRFAKSPLDTINIDAASIDLPESGGPLQLRSPDLTTSIQDSKDLVLVGRGYQSEDLAVAAGRRFLDALTIALARIRVGADFGGRAAKGAFTTAGLRWLEERSGERVLNDVHGLMVFLSEPRVRFARMEARGVRGVPRARFEDASARLS